MMTWMAWLELAGVLVILEIFTGTFYLLMIAIGLAMGGLAAWLGVGDAGQFIVATIVGVATTYALRQSRYGKQVKTDAARDPNVNLDIGQIIQIDEWKNETGQQYTARVAYRGAMWDIELAPHAAPQPGLFKIREMRGSRLIVANSELHGKSAVEPDGKNDNKLQNQ
jgi:membrane protein implicated in regulation of membrane protease activity